MDKLKAALNSKFLNNQDKKPLLKNYFFVITIISVIVLLTVCFSLGFSSYPQGEIKGILWFFMAIRQDYVHHNIAHIVLNSITAICVGFILERQVGSLKYFGLLLLSIILAPNIISLYRNNLNWGGYSNTNWMQYTWVFYIFALSCIHFKENKFNFFTNLVPILFLFGSMFYPFNDITQIAIVNPAHWLNMLVGLGLLTINLGYYHLRKYILKK